MSVLLKVENLHSYIQQFHVLQGVSFEAKEGEITVILGRNGAGKTTLFRTITNVIRPSEGHVSFNGEEIAGLATYQVIGRGIAMVPSSRSVFSTLTVKENFKIAYRGPRSDFQERLSNILRMFPELERAFKRDASSLSGGEREMLAISCGLINNVKLLMLDEPSEGLSPLMVTKVMDALSMLKKQTTILLVEQNFNAVKRIGDTCYFMDKGQITHQTKMEELKNDSGVLRKYLGVSF